MTDKGKVAVFTLGCKVNQYESACIVSDFIKQGYQLVSFDSDADVYVINTCTVTNRTDYKSRNAIRKVLKKKQTNPAIKLIVTGCYAELNPKNIEKLGDVDLIVGNNLKPSVYDIFENGRVEIRNEKDVFNETSIKIKTERVRAFVKIQEGCNFFCAYCIVPYARGNPRSRSPENVLHQIKNMVAMGYQEFVITGINLGLYGKDFAKNDCPSANSPPKLLELIERIEGVKRIRLSSIEPQLIDEELLAYLKRSAKLCPHFHIPLQSGSNSILKKMNRHYTCEEYFSLLAEIIEYIPDAAIGIDIILGLPGEREQYFRETYEFVKSLPINYAHIFPYSKRSGTAAAKMEDQIKHSVAKERCRLIADLVEEKKNSYIQSLVDRNILLSGVLEKEENSCWTALSDHYIRIYLRNDNFQEGDFITMRTVSKMKDGVMVVR